MTHDLYIISGACGFLGNNIIRLLNETQPDAEIRALSPPGADRRSLNGLDCTVLDADITDPAALMRPFAAPQEGCSHIYVIHCAGIIEIDSRPNPDLYRVNVEGTGNVLHAVRTLQKAVSVPVRFLEVGSVHAVPEQPHGTCMTETDDFDPERVNGQYAKSKAEASALVMEAAREGLDALILEPSGILGPNNFSPGNMKEFFRVVAKGKLRICVPGGYNFVDVRDVADGILRACRLGRKGESYLLTNRFASMLELANHICELTDRRPISVLLPLWLARAAAPVCEAYYRARRQIPLFTSYAVDTVHTNSDFRYTKAAKEFGYSPRPLEETVRDMLTWMQAQDNW